MIENKLEQHLMSLFEKAMKNKIAQSETWCFGKKFSFVIYDPAEIGCYFLSHKDENKQLEKIKEEY